MSAETDPVYTERNALVAYLSTQYASVVTKTDIEGWKPEWHNCVYILTPKGQMSWHFHDRDAPLFAHLDSVEPGTVLYDGHTTEEKYARLAALVEMQAEI